ncbi:DUF6470 family protein [Micromonospora sp. CPCC 205558]|uniref:DUF6470 family protein n=1 Tax=Micromonospora sp. CPCC 205558 TaxID=3122403 RepID=UPI003FA5FA81
MTQPQITTSETTRRTQPRRSRTRTSPGLTEIRDIGLESSRRRQITEVRASASTGTAGATLDIGAIGATLDIRAIGATLDIRTTSATLDIRTTSATLDIRTTSATLDIRTTSATLDIRTTSATLDIRTTSATLDIRTTSAGAGVRQLSRGQHVRDSLVEAVAKRCVDFTHLLIQIIETLLKDRMQIIIEPGELTSEGKVVRSGNPVPKVQVKYRVLGTIARLSPELIQHPRDHLVRLMTPEARPCRPEVPGTSPERLRRMSVAMQHLRPVPARLKIIAENLHLVPQILQ